MVSPSLIRSGQLCGNMAEQRVAASTLRRYFYNQYDDNLMMIIMSICNDSIFYPMRNLRLDLIREFIFKANDYNIFMTDPGDSKMIKLNATTWKSIKIVMDKDNAVFRINVYGCQGTLHFFSFFLSLSHQC